MRKYTVIAILILVFGICIAGCAEKGEASQEEPTSTEEAAQDVNGIQPVTLVQAEPIPVKYDYEIYKAWHARTTEILTDNVGSHVKIYSYNMMLSGKIVEVGEFFVVIHDSVAGTCYVDIDSINAISVLE